MPKHESTISPFTAEYLRSIIDYNPETGIFTWLRRAPATFNPKQIRAESVANRWNARFAGKHPKSFDQQGYRHVVINRRKYKAHRLAWLYMTGEWPPEHIDHVDMNPKNNTFANLRLATHAENQRNRGKSNTNKSGFKGVSWDKLCRKWRAQITVRGKHTYLGIFDDPADAHNAYSVAAALHYGEFARTE